MEGPSETGPPTFKLFNHSCLTDKIFKIDKHKLETKHGKIWEYQNEGVPLKRGHQNSNFLTTHANHTKFSWQAKMKKRQNLTKFGVPKWGSLNWVLQKSNFLTI